MEDPNLREEMVRLSTHVSKLTGTSQLAAAVEALKFYISVQDTGVSDSLPIPLNHEDALDAPKLLRAANQMCQDTKGFILEDLITAAGPELILSLQAYKIALGRVLLQAGFCRKQIRRDGSRPLVWHRPQE